MSKGRFIYLGPIIHSESLKKLDISENKCIVVKDGRIEYFDKADDLVHIKKKYEVPDENVTVLGKNQFIVPGFVDTHIHAPQYPNAGLGYDMPLLKWLETYTFPLENKFSDVKFAERVYDAVVKRTLFNGTTTSTYFATIHKNSSIFLAKSAEKYGQRAFIGKVNMIVNSPEYYKENREQSLIDTREFIDKILALNNPLIKPIITPRFAISCDMPFMKLLGELAKEYNLPIQSHVSENKTEIEVVAKLYPECRNYVDVYDTAGLVTNKTVLAHGVYLKPEEIEVLKKKGATISHCPNSNCLIQSGLCPLRHLIESGLKISLGTDCSGGSSVSMLDAIRQTLQSSNQAQFNGLGERLSYSEAFYLATVGGAEGTWRTTLSISDITGNFKVGKQFDAIIVNMNNNSIDLLDDYSISELFQKFIYIGDDRVMEKVFVAGKQVK